MDGMMKGRTCLVTGGTSGIGKETVLGLARMGARVVFTARSEDTGVATRDGIIRASGNPSTEFIKCDLADLAAVRDCCRELMEASQRLDILVNNAGTWRPHREVSKDGIEMTFAVNHLSHFLMTNLLLDVLKKSAHARVISVSSGLHGGTVNFDDIGFARRYRGMAAYRQSKLANILFTKELSRRLSGSNMTANCLMPGFVYTDLFRDSSAISKAFVRVFGLSPEEGARTSIFLASSPEVEGITGECFKKKRVVQTSSESNDPKLAAKLWALSEELTRPWHS